MSVLLREPLQVYRVGGLNTRDANREVLIDECRDMENLWFDSDSGAGLKRNGRIKYNSASLGSSGTLGGKRVYQTGGNFFYVAHNGTIYNGAGGTFSSVVTGLNASAQVEFDTYRNMTIACNGIDRPRKLIGTTGTIAGADAPSTVTLSEGGGTTLTGTYGYKITWKTDTAEGNGCTATYITVTDKGILVERPAVPSGFGITHWRIYRTINGGATFFYVTEVGQATSTYTDVNTDATIQGNAVIDETHTAPPQSASDCVLHQERMFYWGVTGAGYTLYPSESGYPEYVRSSSAINTLNNEPIVSCLPLFGELIVYTTSSIQAVYGNGTTGNEYKIRMISPTIGLVARRTLVNVENSHVFLSRSKGVKVYAYDGSGIPKPISDPVQPDMESMATGRIGFACAAYYRRAYLLCFPQTGSGVNNRILGIDLYWSERRGKPQWFKWLNQPLDWMEVFSGPGDAGELYAGGISTGQVWQLDKGRDDDGTTISFKIKTKQNDYGMPEFNKRFRYFYLWAMATPGTVSVEFNVEDGSVLHTETVTLTGSGAEWDSGIWDSGVWATQQRVLHTVPLPDTLVGKTLEITLSSSAANQPMRIEGYSVRWYPERNV